MYNENNQKLKKPNFIKRHYKEFLIIVLGFSIGSLIGGVDKVTISSVDEVNSQIENKTKTLEDKKNQLKILNDKELELQKKVDKFKEK